MNQQQEGNEHTSKGGARLGALRMESWAELGSAGSGRPSVRVGGWGALESEHSLS